MPTYDYKCKNCEYTEVIMHSMEKSLRPKCAKCGKIMTKQIGTGGSLQFKGSGFYVNDYPKDDSEG